MIKLFSMKNQKKDGSDAPKQGTQKRASAAQLRITKGGDKVWFYNNDINESCCKIC